MWEQRRFDSRHLLTESPNTHLSELPRISSRLDATLHLRVESPTYLVTVFGDFPWSTLKDCAHLVVVLGHTFRLGTSREQSLDDLRVYIHLGFEYAYALSTSLVPLVFILGYMEVLEFHNNDIQANL